MFLLDSMNWVVIQVLREAQLFCRVQVPILAVWLGSYLTAEVTVILTKASWLVPTWNTIRDIISMEL